MKSEERHQLARNELQVSLKSWLDRIEPYSNQILGGVVIATIVAVGLILWMRSSAATSDAGWMELSSARTADQFLEIAEDNPGTPVADWATLQAARVSYSSGIETSLTDRKASDENLKQAKDLFDKLLKAKTTPELREESLKGMGMTLEATSGGDLGEAIKAYETLIKEFPESTFKDFAAHRVAELKKPEAGEFYAWFRKQNPKPSAMPLPLDGNSADGQFKMPELPEFDLKSPPPPTTPKTDPVSPGLPAVPPVEGNTPPTAPPTTTPPATTLPETPPTTTPMPMPEAPAATIPPPTPAAPATPAPMPEAPAPSTTPEPAKPANP